MSLEDLEKELYGQKSPEEKRPSESTKKSGSFSDASMANPWGGSKAETSSSNGVGEEIGKVVKWGKIFFISLIVILVALLGVAGFYLYQYFTTKDVSLAINGPAEVLSGVPFTVSVNFENVSDKTLVSPKMSLSLPNGVIFLNDINKRVITQDLSSIAGGQIVKEDFNVMVVGNYSQTYQFDGALSYAYDSSSFSTRFNKSEQLEVLARDPILSLDVSAPDKILNGQDFEVAIKYHNQSSSPLDQAAIKITMPSGFSLSNSDHTIKDSVIDLGSVPAQGDGIINLSGVMIGQESSYSNIVAEADINVGGNTYAINSKTVSFSISASPLSLNVALANQDSVVYPGQNLSFNVSFTNNSDINLSDAILTVQLDGKMFNLSSVSSDGYFDVGQKQITWTAANLPILKQIDAKQSGSTSFKVNLVSDYPVLNMSDKDFTVKVSGQITSPTVPYNVVAQKTVGVSQSEYKVGGNFSIDELAYFAEPSSDIQNSGTFPPQVGQPVQYTIHWKLGTQAADFQDIKINAFLGAGFQWTGKTKTIGISAVPTYDSRTQEITWEIPNLPANSGLIGAAPEAIFQVQYTPPINQVGNRFTIISQTNYSATDSFTQKVFQNNIKPLESKDLSDINLPDKFDRVNP